MSPRWIDLDGAVNARTVVPRVLLRSDNLQSLSDRDVRALTHEHGVEVVLDLRTDIEVELEGPGPMTQAPGVRIEHRSLYPDSGGHTDLELSTLKPWQRLRDDEPVDEPPPVRAYLSYLSRRPDSVVGSIRTIARAERAVLVHCAAGKDRTGVIVALALDAAGFDRAAIVSDYVASSERIQAITERLRGSPTYSAELAGVDPARLAPVPETIERVLGFIDTRWGSTADWLGAHGLEPDELKQLRGRLKTDASAAAAA